MLDHTVALENPVQARGTPPYGILEMISNQSTTGLRSNMLVVRNAQADADT
jgi:hypothetical protein